MNVGILTFHYAYNFGAILQCAGLYKTLRELQCDVDVIDYVPEAWPALPFWRGWGLHSGQATRRIRARGIELLHGPAMKRQFDAFAREHLTFSRRCRTLDDLLAVAMNYDALIVGSDQVWNRSYGRIVTPAYFLDFPGDYLGRRISYAACCGQFLSPQPGDEQVRDALRRFDSLSVRNEVTCRWVRHLTGLSPAIVCDPTLLQDFAGIEGAGQLPFPAYILVYSLGPEIPGGHKAAIRYIREEVGDLPMVWVCPSAHKPQSQCTWADHVVYSAGPAEWLGLLRGASYVYTDSYHGAIFSMKYRKRFLVYHANESRADRLRDLADRYQVGSCATGSVDDARARGSFCADPDFDRVASLMELHRTASMAFLHSALSDA